MIDYLQIYEKFKNSKEVMDYINDVNTLRCYYRNQQYALMQQHIYLLTLKYPIESTAWNSVNQAPPTDVHQSYANADSFLRMQGAKIVARTVRNYALQLSKEETKFIEGMSKEL